MKRKISITKVFLLISGLFFLLQVQAQQRMLTGTITDSNDGSPLPGATVVLKGTTVGTATNYNGEYQINVKTGDVLVVSFVGYEPQEIPISEESVLNLSLNPSTINVDEVVVIGYGTVAKEDATGSITAIDSKDFNSGVISSPQELLSGKVSGVVITSKGGIPGAGSNIRIRGGSSLRANNEPLIVIDGFPIDNSDLGGQSNALSTINPNDIEKFTVLKDASATAIYGSRASNGVIIITTKRGKKGDVRASYNGSVSIGVPVDFLEVYNGDDFRALVQDRVNNHGLASVALTKLGTANTDWQKEIYQNAFAHDHNVSVSGSVKDVPYRASFGYTSQDGLLKKSNMSRTTFDLSASPVLLEGDLKLDMNVKGSYTANDFSNTDAIGAALQFDPTQPITNGNTRYGGYTAWVLDASVDSDPINIATRNPVAQIEFRENTSDVQRYIGNFQADYKMPFAPQLKATVKAGYDYFNSEGIDLTDSLASWSYREPENNYKTYQNTRKNSLLDVYLNYNETFGGIHKLDATAGYSYQHYYREGFNANRPWTKTGDEYLNANNIPYKSENYLLSFFGRANYSLMNKYLFTGTLRFDGSSRFAKENRWGVFPAFAFAWKINEEGFLQDIDVISDLKLRLGYGVTGQQDISDNYYPYIPAYTISQPGAYYQFGNTFYPTQRPDAYDANIKWEETTTQNVGLDFGLFNQRITGAVDIYKRVTDDLLNEIPIAAGTNFSNFLVTNVGSLENKGFEAELVFRAISKQDISWRIAANFSYNVNEITKLTLVDDPDYVGYDDGDIAGGVGNKIQINAIGQPAKTFFMFSQVYDPNGMPIEGLYVDKTGDGGNVSGNNSNKYYLHSPAPDYSIGLSSYFEYKNMDFSFAGRANIGNFVYNNNASNYGLYQSVYNQSGYTQNILKAVEESGFTTAQYWSDFYLEDASFFRMDNMSLGYRFNSLFTEKLDGRVSFTVQNAFVITKYSGLDPEVENGIDNNIFPRPRTFMLGLNLNF
jgi:TonB-linked SusC/RagA family outer membrane protein